MTAPPSTKTLTQFRESNSKVVSALRRRKVTCEIVRAATVKGSVVPKMVLAHGERRCTY